VGSSSHNGGSSYWNNSSNRGSSFPNLSNTTSFQPQPPPLHPRILHFPLLHPRQSLQVLYVTTATRLVTHRPTAIIWVGIGIGAVRVRPFILAKGSATGEYVPAGVGDIDKTDRGVVEIVDDNLAVEDGGSLADSVGYMASTLDSLTIRDDVNN
jgi:hypothetical protein